MSAIVSKSKIAIVTGGSRGLGRSTVLSLAKRGVGSIFTYNSNLAEAEKVSALAAQSEVKAVAVQLNTGHISAFDGFVKRAREILRDFGAERFDYLASTMLALPTIPRSTR